MLNDKQYAMWEAHGCFLVQRKKRYWYGLSDGYRIWNFHNGMCHNVWGTPGYADERFPAREDMIVSQFLLLHSDDITWVWSNGCRDSMTTIIKGGYADPWLGVPDRELPPKVREKLKEIRRERW